MNDLLSRIEEWRAGGEDVAIATLVRVIGSAPRQPGARLLMTRSGLMEGSVSGGCVENDVYERAMTVLDSRRPESARYGISDELGLEVGLSCGGDIEVLIEPAADDPVLAALRDALNENASAVLAIAVEPATVAGAKLLIKADGAVTGEISPDTDSQIVAACREMLGSEGTDLRTIPAGGKDISVFLESYTPAPHLRIIGATHTAVPLCRMAKMAGFNVTVIDARSLFALEERFPDADEVTRDWPDRVLAGTKLDEFSYIVVLAHDPKFEIPCLEMALRSPARYIGAIGSRVTHSQRRGRLAELGFSDDDIARIHAPIGLNIGGRTPEEIAVSILAEMISVRYGRREALGD